MAYRLVRHLISTCLACPGTCPGASKTRGHWTSIQPISSPADYATGQIKSALWVLVRWRMEPYSALRAANKLLRSVAWPREARPTARSAVPREARPPPKAAGAEGAPELREGFKRKLGCDSTAAIQFVASIQPGSAGKRALHVRDMCV